MTYLSPEWRQKLIDSGFPEDELKLGVCEEILRRLPPSVKVGGLHECTTFLLQANRCGETCSVGYQSVNDATHFKYKQFGDSLVNAAAAMWIYLKENNLLPHVE